MLRYFVFAISLIQLSQAQELKNELRVKYQYYDDNNGVRVNQPMIKINQRITDNFGLNGHVLIDALSAASRRVFYPKQNPDTTNLKETEDNNSLSLDAVSAASVREVRQQYGGGLTVMHNNSTGTISSTYSRENDYRSISGSMDVRQDLFNQNSNITMNYTFFNDSYEPISRNLSYSDQAGFYQEALTSYGKGGDKKVHSATLGWTQTLTRRTLAMLNWGITVSDGYLGRPYYYVIVQDTGLSVDTISMTPEDISLLDLNASGGTPYQERFPNTKTGNAVVFRLRQGFPSFIREGAVEIEFRKYLDNWGLGSNTVTLSLFHYIHHSLFIHFRYRFYQQDPADFYRDRYYVWNVNPNDPQYLAYRTVDARLSDFDSHLFQLKFVFVLKNFFKPETEGLFAVFPTRFDLEVERYLRTTHADSQIRERRYEFYDDKGLTAWLIRGGLVFSY